MSAERSELEALQAETKRLERELRTLSKSPERLELEGAIAEFEERRAAASARVLANDEARRQLHQYSAGAEWTVAFAPVITGVVVLGALALGHNGLRTLKWFLALAPIIVTGGRVGVAVARRWWRERRLRAIRATLTPPR